MSDFLIRKFEGSRLSCPKNIQKRKGGRIMCLDCLRREGLAYQGAKFLKSLAEDKALREEMKIVSNEKVS